MKKFKHIYPEFMLENLKCEYHSGERFYVVPDGERYQSITSILSNLSKAGISAWRKRVGEKEANRISGKASRRGSAVHHVCEQYINNQDGYGYLDELPHIVEMFLSIEPLLDRIDNVRAVETALWSDELKIAGRTDLIAEFDGQLAIIDYKTSSRIKTWEMCASYFMQGTFYAHAFEERTGIPIENIVIIMAVEGDKPLLFRETKSRWLSPLKEVIYKYA